MPSHQEDAGHHEGKQQQHRIAEALAERLIELGGVDFDHHAEAGESNRAIGRHDAMIQIIERFDDAGLEVERVAHGQRPSVDLPRNMRRMRIGSQRKALQPVALRRAQRHRSRIAP